VPIHINDVDVHKTSTGGIKLDLNVVWESKSDIDLEGKLIPKIGIQHIHMKGRLSVLLAPLTNVIPLIGAAQVAFINPPELSFDFTDGLSFADLSIISNCIRKVVLGIIGGMAVLPNRFLVKLDNSNDWFKTYQPALGVLRLTVEKAVGIAGPKKSGAKRLLQKLVKDVPDCYCKVKVGAGEEWRTTTKKDNRDPDWNETHDFLVADFEQNIFLDIQDADVGEDDDMGIGHISVKDILLGGGTKEVGLTHNGQPTGAILTVHAQFFNFTPEAPALAESHHSQGDGQIAGLATILIANVNGLNGNRDDLMPSVKVSWGGKDYRTAKKTYTPGTDIFNPGFDTAFQVPLTQELARGQQPFQVSLMNKEEVTGSVEIPFADVMNSEEMTVADTYDVGSGATVRVSISMRGLQQAQ